MTDRLRWGILATGGIAELFAADLQLIGAPIGAVGSRSIEGARAFGDRFGIPRAHGSYQELVDDPEIDVVYIATPHPMHAENALLALRAGKHVLVEKAFTLNQTQAREVVDEATRRGLVVLEAMWTRWLPHMVRIRELIAAGGLGEVRGLIADHDQKLPTDPSHRLQDPRLGGGALLDLGIYPVSLAWDLFGQPNRIHAISDPTPTGVDGQTSILLGFPGNRQAVLHTLLDGRGPGTAVIVGTEARIEIDPIWYAPTSFSLIDPDDRVLERFEIEVPGRGMQFQAEALERIVASGELAGAELPPEETVAIMGTLDEIRRQIGLRYPGE